MAKASSWPWRTPTSKPRATTCGGRTWKSWLPTNRPRLRRRTTRTRGSARITLRVTRAARFEAFPTFVSPRHDQRLGSARATHGRKALDDFLAIEERCRAAGFQLVAHGYGQFIEG